MKKVFAVMMATLMVLMLLLPTVVSVSAAGTYDADEKIDVSKKSNLTVTYEGLEEGTTVYAYKLADVDADFQYTIAPKFASYPINFAGMKDVDGFVVLAKTVAGYVVADKIASDVTAVVGKNGTVVFENLDNGMYFFPGITMEKAEGVYHYAPVIIAAPTVDAVTHKWVYDVIANPKKSTFDIRETEMTATVVWQDEGYESKRPTELTLELYKNGDLNQKAIITANDNWTFSWEDLGALGQWDVIVRGLPTGYKVAVTPNGTTFSIVCTYVPEPIPQTSDSANVYLICAISGVVLVAGIFAFGAIRRKNDKKA